MNNDVFFLGAGFSKAIDNSFPTLQELTNEIKTNFQCEKGSVAQHLHNEIPEQYKNNVELLLTFLSSNLPYKTDVQISTDEALYKDITSKLAKYFENKEINPNNFDEVKILCKYIYTKKIPCITLNYDLLLENLISKSNNVNLTQYQNFYNIPITPLRNRTFSSLYICDACEPEDLPPVLKLHGSINWLYSGITATDPIYCKDFTFDDEHSFLAKDLKTMIVPPVLDKSSQYFNTILKSLWRQAFEKLKKAQNIYIYGFSFPPTDLSIKFLFQSALSNNHNNPKIYVINTKDAISPQNKNYIKDRFEDIFKGYNLNFDYCCDNSLIKFQDEILSPKIGGQNNE